MALSIGDLASIATAMTLLVALVLGIRQAIDMEKKRRQDATIEVLQRFQTGEWVETIRYVFDLRKPTSREELVTRPQDASTHAMHVVQQMEVLGVLVAERVVDIDIIEKTLGSFVTDAWDKLSPQLEYAREYSGDPKIAEYFQWLAERMAEREGRNPTLPAYVALRRWRA